MVERQKVESLSHVEDEIGVVFADAPIFMVVVDEHLKIHRINKAAQEFSGKERGKQIGSRLGRLMHCLHSLETPGGCGFSLHCPECPIHRAVTETLSGDVSHQRIEVHFPLFEDDSQAEAYLILSTSPLTISGRRMILICIEDFTEQKLIEQALVENEKLFDSFMDNNPAVAYMKDEEGRYVYLNKIFEDRFHIKLLDWRGKTDMEVWPTHLARQFRAHDLAVLKANTTKRMIETTVEEGERYYWLSFKFPFQDARGRRLVGGVSVDITELKQAQEQLRTDEVKFRTIADYTYNWENWIDPEGQLLWINPSVERITGYTVAECMSMPSYPMEMIYEEDREMVASKFQEGMRNVPGKDFEFRIRCKNGSIIWVSVSWQSIYDEQGVSLGHRSSIRDITERKEAEFRLQELLQTSEDIVRSIPSGLFIYQYEEPDQLILIKANPAAEHITGVFTEDWLGREFNEIWPQARGQMLTEEFLEVVKTGRTFETEELNYRDDRIEGAFLIRAFRMPGNRLGVAFENITRHRQAELALLQNEEKYRAIFENVLIGLFRTRLSDGKILECNDRFAIKLGYENREMVLRKKRSIEDYFDQSRYGVMMEELVARGCVRNFEISLQRKDSKVLWLNLAGRLMSKMGYIEWAAADITKERYAWDEFKREKERAQRYLDIASVILVVVDKDQTVSLINKKGCEILGYEEREIIGKNWFDAFLPDSSREAVKATFQQIISGHMELSEYYENSVLTKSGEERIVAWHNTPIRDSGQMIGTLSSGHDITERKQAEEALAISEAKYRSVTDDVLDCSEVGLFILDADFKIAWINRAIESFFGLEREQVIGKDKRDLILTQISNIFENSQEFINKVVSTYDNNTYVEKFECHILGDGKRQERWLEHRSFPIISGFYAGGRMEQYIDITERKGTMEEIENLARFPAENPNPVLRVSREGTILYANSASSVVFESWGCREGGHIPEFCQQLLVEAFDSGKVSRFEHDCLNGHICSITLAPVVESGYVNVYGLDITERKQAEAELEESQRTLSTLIGNLPGMAYRCKNDKDRTIEFVSEGSKGLTGYLSEELTSNNRITYAEVIHSDDREHVRNRIQQALEAKKPFELTYRITTAGGEHKWVWEQGCGVFSAADELLALEGFITDITDRKRAEEQLRYNAFHDSLTSLPNRTLFLDRMDHAANRVKRISGSMFAVLFLDLDRFKVINDSLGHAAGDRLLCGVTERLKECLRPGDTIARPGGDEFTILLEDINDITDATHLAGRIQRALSSPFRLDGQEVFITTSIGITLSSRGYDQIEHLLRDADTAMYRAKARGKARYEIFDKEMHQRAVTRLKLETDMRRALDRQEIKVFYQPIVSLPTGRIMAFEALLRWQHSQHGLLLPKEFLPIAEETGYDVPLGQMVIESVCEQLKQWQQEYPQDPPLSISLNLSRRQLTRPELIDEIDEILKRSSLSPGSIMFEITENTVMGDSEAIIEMIKSLRDLKVQLLIDDFGTGHSSLSLLHSLPINTLKIDQSFVRKLGKEQEGCEIIHAVINLARSLKMMVIAEGCETAEQLVQLRQLKCDYAQGNYFSAALESEAAVKLLGKQLHW